jgi:tRNA threonylcarbamoyl adenosine modification protein (Sua5/YciO/YrdC/YwlC family)
MQTRLLDAHAPRDVDVAVAILVDGGLVGIPSETVYGLAANASLPEAVRRVFAAKGRPADHPLILHVSDIAHARAASSDWTEAAEILARTFWPGPLTVIVTKSEGVDPVVTGGQDSVALRVPGHDVFLDVLRKLSDLGSIGIAAPSANRFGHVSPTTAQHVLDDLDGVIDGVLDGGSASIGVESTIVDCTVSPPRVLRPGGIPTEDIDLALEMAGHRVTDERGDGSSGVSRSWRTKTRPKRLPRRCVKPENTWCFLQPTQISRRRHANSLPDCVRQMRRNQTSSSPSCLRMSGSVAQFAIGSSRQPQLVDRLDPEIPQILESVQVADVGGEGDDRAAGFGHHLAATPSRHR